MVIAFDGYSSTGKSTLAKEVAKILGFTHIDTGAMYRAITLYGLSNFFEGGNSEINIEQLIQSLPNIEIEFRPVGTENHVFLNGEDVEEEIRSPRVSDYVSKVASYPEIRKFLVEKQRAMQHHHNIVMDGRDIGTVVFPNAELKYFITADVEERARRRYKDLKKEYPDITLDEVKENLLARDEADVNREHSPLKKADDAVLIDNTHQTKEHTIQQILQDIYSKYPNLKTK